MRLLYLYPEEWLGRRAREVHTLSTCAALARAGLDVTLAIAGGQRRAEAHLEEIAGHRDLPGLRFASIPRGAGPIRSAAVFAWRFRRWAGHQPRFDAGYVIHLKAAAALRRAGIPYLYEAHEIFAETPQKSVERQESLQTLEREALAGAAWRVATSKALAAALRAHYVLPNDFIIVPNAGQPSLPKSVAAADGPFVYAGSIAEWKGLETILAATRAAAVPLKIVGGSKEEWDRLAGAMPADHVGWEPRVPLAGLPAALTGARAGLVPTRPDSASGRYSCPMKLFDYARCGLPVLTTALASLDSLDAGSWCVRVPASTAEAWTEALRDFRFSPVLAETARAWAGAHTWAERAGKIQRVLKL